MKTIKAMIKEQLAVNQSYLDEHNAIQELLNTVDGKPANKVTFSKRHCAPLGLKLEISSGMFYLQGKYRHLISYNGMVDASKFYDYDACHSEGAEARIARLQSLDVKRLEQIYKKIAKHYEALRECFGDLERDSLGSHGNPLYYHMLTEIDPNQDRTQSPVLSDFWFIRK